MKTNMNCDNCEGTDTCCSQVIRVTPLEVQRLGLQKGTDFMNLDNSICQFYSLGRCQVYSKRPRACITFNCCNPNQLSFEANVPEEERQAIKDKLEPKHWLSVELQKRLKRKVV